MLLESNQEHFFCGKIYLDTYLYTHELLYHETNFFVPIIDFHDNSRTNIDRYLNLLESSGVCQLIKKCFSSKEMGGRPNYNPRFTYWKAPENLSEEKFKKTNYKRLTNKVNKKAVKSSS